MVDDIAIEPACYVAMSMLPPTSLAYDPDMPHYDTHAHHTISWVDLAAKDLSGAIEFYAEMMGWTSFNDGETPYHVFQRDGIAVADTWSSVWTTPWACAVAR